MCRLIMKEKIHFQGKYHDDTSELAQLEYPDLVAFAWVELNIDDYLRIYGTYELKALVYMLGLMTTVL